MALGDEALGPRPVAARVLAEPVNEGDDRPRLTRRLPPLGEDALRRRLLPVTAQATCFSGSTKAAASRRRSRRWRRASTVAGTRARTEIPTAHQKVEANAAASGSATFARTASGRRGSVPEAGPPLPAPGTEESSSLMFPWSTTASTAVPIEPPIRCSAL